MSIKDRINNGYFEWMVQLVCGNRYSKLVSFRKLLMCLHDTEFIFTIPKDENRAYDGIDLRFRYAYEQGHEDLADYLDGPCSILEMMVALSIRCEENIMDDPTIGDRTGQWFWSMITNLGLGSMTDDHFDIEYVEEVIERFLNRDYEPDGRGGLFTIRHCDQDVRDVEIWIQLLWYLDSIV